MALLNWELALLNKIVGLRDEDFSVEVLTAPDGDCVESRLATMEVPMTAGMSPARCMNCLSCTNSRPFASADAGTLLITGFTAGPVEGIRVQVAYRPDGGWNSLFDVVGIRRTAAIYPEVDFGRLAAE